ncbi:Nif3-like dinuclear metal center hexameric protein [Alteromonas lipolytica]|uniref:Nif3-like dinuclear metal center hexameric protein n=1 Tax=Alteromonas lipolytica TaxID=1856405 RepID=A0A1E8FGL4_9ALTE|nr:Nif3-like dinuclear metal center hexameric protein [Alteromonas lipolytica]OFI35097.1 Nif3-like dinuclear metal center hexameric protein [Alteromonas lipolytica]GGF56624.1 GTP cyclohydrolase 1 type 2 [Alteromonas lipolytica]
MLTNQLVSYLNQELQVAAIKDYCPNGLQIEGRPVIEHLVTGVTASQQLIDAAIAVNADAILVHHGYFWKGESEVLTGMKKRRIASLLSHDINLLAYHLPIDVHSHWGNNAQLGKVFELEDIEPLATVSPAGIVYQGRTNTTLGEFAALVSNKLGRDLVVCEGDTQKSIGLVAWCTGGGQGFIEQAAAAGCDLFISGEVSEQTIHVAREMGIAFIAAGHHATERYGVKAVGEHLAEEFDLTVTFIDIDNPA